MAPNLYKGFLKSTLYFTMWLGSESRIVALPELASHSENVLEYVLPLVANIYAIFNPLTGGTHHLTIVMYLPQ
jgi:hypothetical protein